MRDADEVLNQLFEQARAVQFNERARIELTPADVQVLVSDDAALARFIIRFKREAQSAELRAIIRVYFKSIASTEESLATDMRIDADGVQEYLGRVGIGAAGGGIMLLATAGAMIGTGGLALLGGGLIAILASGLTTTGLRKRASRMETRAKRIRELLEDLDGD